MNSATMEDAPGAVSDQPGDLGQVIELNAEPLGISQVCAVARGARVHLGPIALDRIRGARALVEKVFKEGTAIYGLNTGLGAAVDTHLSGDELKAFQVSVTRSHRAAVGPSLTREQVRALMATRLSGIAQGGAGVSLGIAESLAAVLNAGIHPVVPSLGSVGAADLSALAPVANALIGEGLVEYRGSVVPASEALAVAGLEPAAIHEKDGHTLVVANSLSVGMACLTLDEAARALDWSLRAVALNYEAFRCNLRVLDRDALGVRPAFGQVEIGDRLRELMASSGLWDLDNARRLQDPLSFRCVPQVTGALSHALTETVQATEIELTSAGENPVVLARQGRIIPTGNFDLTAFALSWERLGLALSQCASATTQRIIKIMSTTTSELPRFLTTQPGHSGFGQVQRTASALEAEIRHLANPISFNPVPVSDGVEDQASMAPRVVAKTSAILERFWYLISIELLAAAQAVELRGVEDTMGVGPRQAYDLVRSHAPHLDDDRAVSVDVLALAEVFKSHRGVDRNDDTVAAS